MDRPDVTSQLPNKSLWRDKKSATWSFYCPQCRAARKIPYHPRPGSARHFAQIGLTAAMFTLLTWGWFSWKGIVSFVPFWIIFEAIYRSRVRVAVACPHCGFDPFLYMVDVKKARAEIEAHWRRKFAERGVPFPERDGQSAGPQQGEVPGDSPDDGGDDSGLPRA